MSCIIDNGYAPGCQTVGGIETLYIGTYDKDLTYQFDTDNVITGATTGGTVYEFAQDQEHAGLEQTGQFSMENGTVFYESVLSAKFIELDKELRNTLLSLGKAPIYAIAKSNAGHHYLLGVEAPGRASEGTASLGTAMGDMNGGDISFTFKSKNGAYLFDENVLGNDITVQ